MVVVLLGCAGATAGLAFGTWSLSSDQPRVHFRAVLLPVENSCDSHWRLRLAPDVPGLGMGKHDKVHVGGKCRTIPPAIITPGSVASGRRSIGSYILLGLLAGLSAALGFLVPPRSRLTRT